MESCFRNVLYRDRLNCQGRRNNNSLFHEGMPVRELPLSNETTATSSYSGVS